MNSLAQSAVVPIDNEPAPKLTVEAPLPGPLAQNVVHIPYRVENLRIMPLGGSAALNLSPRVGHLHITVDDLPWYGRITARATPSFSWGCSAGRIRS